MKKQLAAAAFAGLVIGLIGVFYFGYVKSDPAFAVNNTKSIQANGINKISLESRSSSVHFYPSSNNELTVHLKGNSSRKDMVFSLTKSDDTAVIDIGPKEDQRIHLSLFSFLNNNLEADVEVPQKMYSEITGHSKAGSIEIEQLSAGRFDLDSSAGSINGDDLTGDVSAHSSAGSIKLNNMNGKLDLTSSAGSVEVQLKAITHDITARSSAGSVKIVTAQQPDSLKLSLQTSAGSVNLNLANVTYSTKENDRAIGSIGSGGPTLQLQSSAGSVTIQKQ